MHKSLTKTVLLLIIVFFLIPACLSHLNQSHQKTPLEIVAIFMSTYGTPKVSQFAYYTTPYFRNYKPKELWVIETWEVLSELGYRHLSGKILEKKIKGKKAVVIASSNIETLAGKTLQREIYCFVKTEEGWKLDELLIEDETVEAAKYNL